MKKRMLRLLCLLLAVILAAGLLPIGALTALAAEPPAITVAALEPGETKLSYSQKLTANVEGIFEVEGLPSGLSVEENTISGIPQQAGSFPVTLVFTPESGDPITLELTLQIAPHTCIYSEDYKYNSHSHWRICACGSKKEYEGHYYFDGTLVCYICDYTNKYHEQNRKRWAGNEFVHWPYCECGSVEHHHVINFSHGHIDNDHDHVCNRCNMKLKPHSLTISIVGEGEAYVGEDKLTSLQAYPDDLLPITIRPEKLWYLESATIKYVNTPDAWADNTHVPGMQFYVGDHKYKMPSGNVEMVVTFAPTAAAKVTSGLEKRNGIMTISSEQGMESWLGYSEEERAAVTHVAIEEGVTAILDGAFAGCKALEDIVIPASVTSIGQDAFRDCVNLSELVIPGSVQKIGQGAFDGCTTLEEIVLDMGDLTEGTYSLPVSADRNPEMKISFRGGDFAAQVSGADLPEDAGTLELFAAKAEYTWKVRIWTGETVLLDTILEGTLAENSGWVLKKAAPTLADCQKALEEVTGKQVTLESETETGGVFLSSDELSRYTVAQGQSWDIGVAENFRSVDQVNLMDLDYMVTVKLAVPDDWERMEPALVHHGELLEFGKTTESLAGKTYVSLQTDHFSSFTVYGISEETLTPPTEAPTEAPTEPAVEVTPEVKTAAWVWLILGLILAALAAAVLVLKKRGKL